MTLIFNQTVKATSKTWLDPSAYDFLLLETPSRRELCSNWTRTILYRVNNANVWLVIPIYENSIPNTPQYPEYIPVITTKYASSILRPFNINMSFQKKNCSDKAIAGENNRGV